MKQSLRILLVEDSPLDMELTLTCLDKNGFDCHAVRVDTASAFCAALERGEFDLILADFVLPTFSGMEALRLARERVPDSPFIFVSGMLGEENAVDMLKNGATDYVLKQRLQRLPAVVLRALGERDVRRQRVLAERALRRSETHFRQLVDALKDYAVISLDTDGAIGTWNAAAERIFGYRSQETIGRSPDIFYRDSQQRDGLLAAQLHRAREQGSSSDERWLWCKDGHSIFASIVTTATRDEGGDIVGYSQIVRDATHARMAADALELAKEQAETANRAKDHFLAVLSHELRTPLTPILAAVRLIQLRDDVSPAMWESLELIRRNVELEARLIDDLLDLTRIARGKLSLNFEPVRLDELVDRALAMSQADIDAKQLHLSVERRARRTLVSGDAARVQQIIWNIVKNAVKFTPLGGSIHVALDNPSEDSVVVDITDSGIGISAEALPRIFSAFEQADDSIRRSFGGLGLGLAIANTLAQKHGGVLQVSSEGHGKGARFSMTLPLMEESGRPAPEPSRVPAQQQAARGLSLLLVEDNEDTAAAMASLLEILGHEVERAASVREARERIRAGRFDVLISDIGLPDGSGFEVVGEWKAYQHRAPSIAITGYGMEEDVRRSHEAGFTDHLTKPLSFDRLEQLLAQLTEPRPGD